MTLSFEDLEHKETYMPSFSGPNEEVYKIPSFLISEEGFMSLLNTVFTATLVLYYVVLRILNISREKYGVILEVSTSYFYTEVPTQSLQSSHLLYATAPVKSSQRPPC